MMLENNGVSGAINTAMMTALMEMLPTLVRRLIQEPEQMAQQAHKAIARRLEALAKVPAERDVGDPALPWTRGSQNVEQEVVRLRCLRGLLHTVSQSGTLSYILGMVQIDGRPGDYVQPKAHASVPPPTEEERLEEEVNLSILAAEAFPDEVGVVWVARPAAEAAAEAITRRGRAVEVRRQPAHVIMDAKPWTVRDLLLVHPEVPKPSEE